MKAEQHRIRKLARLFFFSFVVLEVMLYAPNASAAGKIGNPSGASTPKQPSQSLGTQGADQPGETGQVSSSGTALGPSGETAGTIPAAPALSQSVGTVLNPDAERDLDFTNMNTVVPSALSLLAIFLALWALFKRPRYSSDYDEPFHGKGKNGGGRPRKNESRHDEIVIVRRKADVLDSSLAALHERVVRLDIEFRKFASSHQMSGGPVPAGNGVQKPKIGERAAQMHHQPQQPPIMGAGPANRQGNGVVNDRFYPSGQVQNHEPLSVADQGSPQLTAQPPSQSSVGSVPEPTGIAAQAQGEPGSNVDWLAGGVLKEFAAGESTEPRETLPPQPPPPPPPPPPPSVGYASLPEKDGTFKTLTEKQDWESLYRLRFQGDSATASIAWVDMCDNPEKFKTAMAAPAIYLIPVCDYNSNPLPSATAIVVIHKGLAERKSQDDRWKIRDKLDIEFR